MAVIETWYNQDLQNPVKVHYLNGNLFSHNGNGNRIGVHVFDNGEPVTLAGTVSGYVVTSDGSTVPCTGSRSGNNASILVPPAAYQPGAVFITVFLTDGSTVTTLASVSTSVLVARTENQVSPGSVVTDWTQTINAAMQEVETAADNLGHIVATPYEILPFPVPLGKYTYYNDNLYRCISPIASSESFTPAHWSSALNLGDEVSSLKSALLNNIETSCKKTDNLIDIDFCGIVCGWYPNNYGGNHSYTIHSEKIPVSVSDTYYFVLSNVDTNIYGSLFRMHVYTLNSSGEKVRDIRGYASDSVNTASVTIASGETHVVVNLDTENYQIPITTEMIYNSGMKIYFGKSNIKSKEIYPMYISQSPEDATKQNSVWNYGTVNSSGVFTHTTEKIRSDVLVGVYRIICKNGYYCMLSFYKEDGSFISNTNIIQNLDMTNASFPDGSYFVVITVSNGTSTIYVGEEKCVEIVLTTADAIQISTRTKEQQIKDIIATSIKTDNLIDLSIVNIWRWHPHNYGGSQVFAIHCDPITVTEGDVYYIAITNVDQTKFGSMFRLHVYTLDSSMNVVRDIRGYASDSVNTASFTVASGEKYISAVYTTEEYSIPITIDMVYRSTVLGYVGKTDVKGNDIYPMYMPKVDELQKEVNALQYGTVAPYVMGSYNQICRLGWKPYDSSTPPEQSIKSYELAYKNGCRIMLVDLRVTADNKIVCFHDADLGSESGRNIVRHADGTDLSAAEKAQTIASLTLSQLNEYDYGIYKGSAYAGTKILQLDDFLEWCSFTNCYPFFETKIQMTQSLIHEVSLKCKRYQLQRRCIVGDGYDYLASVVQYWISELPECIAVVRGGTSMYSTCLQNARAFATAGIETYISFSGAMGLISEEHVTEMAGYNIGVEYSYIEDETAMESFYNSEYFDRVHFIVCSSFNIQKWILDKYNMG